MPPSVWRTDLRPGEITYLWSRAGGLASAALPPGWAREPVARRAVMGWDADLHTGVRVPADLKFPKDALEFDLAGVTITVHKLPKAAAVRYLSPGATAAEIEYRLRDGYDVELRPGLYRLTRCVHIPAGRAVRGYGAVLWRVPDGDYQERVFHPADRVTLEGLTVRGDGPSRYLFSGGYEDPNLRAENVTARNCTFTDGTMIGEFNPPGLWCDGCEWVRSSAGPVYGPALLSNCRWLGTDAATNPGVLLWGAADVALVDCDWHNVAQGVSVQGFRGSTRGVLLTGPVMENLSLKQNGCEGFGVEGPGALESCMLLHHRYRGEGHAVNFWDAPASNNLVRDFTADGGVGVELAGYNGVEQTGNVICDGEIRGGCLMFATHGDGARGNEARNLLVRPCGTRGHQFHQSGPAEAPKPVWDRRDESGKWLNDWQGVTQAVDAAAEA